MTDKELILPISPRNEKKGVFSKEEMRRLFLLDKLSTPAGISVLFLFLGAVGAGTAYFGLLFGLGVLVAFIAIPAVYTIVAYPRIGIFIFLSMSFFIFLFSRIGVNFPLGTLMDGIEVLFVISMLIGMKKKPEWYLFKSPVTGMILLWIVYNLIEVGNPTAESRAAWMYTVRSVAIIMIMFFIFIYNVRTIQYVRQIFVLWMILATFGALWGLKQEFMGFTGFEDAWLHSNDNIQRLLFIGGVWRKFSIFNDPVIFAYTMVVAACLCIGILTGPVSKKKKRILYLVMFTCLFSMLYSGTRGAFVLVPAALILFGILRFNKTILFIAVSAGIVFIFLINISTSNNTLYRFQSAFKPDKDLSYLVRKNNQKRIQPFIQSHPLGGGLGSTGEWGERFSPNSYLAHFPPDSGYVRVAVECGWLGLFIFCTLMFTILKTGINNYYAIKDPELKSYALAMLLIVCAFNIGNFPQEALVQFPSNVFFYLVAALIVILRRLDEQKSLNADAGK